MISANSSCTENECTRSVCVYVCMYVCMYVLCMYMCVCVCVFMYMHACKQIHLASRTSVCMYACMYMCVMCVCMSYICMHASKLILHREGMHTFCMCVCMYVICMYMCMHACMHVCFVSTKNIHFARIHACMHTHNTHTCTHTHAHTHTQKHTHTHTHTHRTRTRTCITGLTARDCLLHPYMGRHQHLTTRRTYADLLEIEDK